MREQSKAEINAVTVAEVADMIAEYVKHLDDWQPISTAPKGDASLIGYIVPKPGEFGKPRATEIYWTPGDVMRGYWYHTDGVGTEWQPTHWKPLTAPAQPEEPS